MEFSTDRTMLMASIQPLDLAKRLGLNAISVIEMGVAGAKGLLALEGIAKTAGANFGLRIHVTGFDSGQGMPAPADFRPVTDRSHYCPRSKRDKRPEFNRKLVIRARVPSP